MLPLKKERKKNGKKEKNCVCVCVCGGGGLHERDRQTEKIILYQLHKDKDISTVRLYYSSVPDDKDSNTQIRQTKVQIIAAN